MATYRFFIREISALYADIEAETEEAAQEVFDSMDWQDNEEWDYTRIIIETEIDEIVEIGA